MTSLNGGLRLSTAADRARIRNRETVWQAMRRLTLEFIENSDRITLIASGSIAGLIFVVRLRDGEGSPFRGIRRLNDTQLNEVEVREILIKLTFLQPDRVGQSGVYGILQRDRDDPAIEISSREDFDAESQMQRDVYARSICSVNEEGQLKLFEPICPFLITRFIDGETGPQTATTDALFVKLMEHGVFVPRPDRRGRNGAAIRDVDIIRDLIDAKQTGTLPSARDAAGRTHRVLIAGMVMENMERSHTFRDLGERQIAANGAFLDRARRFVHMRLNRLGYIHTDAHNANVMWSPYDQYYQGSGRVIIIDCGRMIPYDRRLLERNARGDPRFANCCYITGGRGVPEDLDNINNYHPGLTDREKAPFDAAMDMMGRIVIHNLIHSANTDDRERIVAELMRRIMQSTDIYDNEIRRRVERFEQMIGAILAPQPLRLRGPRPPQAPQFGGGNPNQSARQLHVELDTETLIEEYKKKSEDRFSIIKSHLTDAIDRNDYKKISIIMALLIGIDMKGYQNPKIRMEFSHELIEGLIDMIENSKINDDYSMDKYNRKLSKSKTLKRKNKSKKGYKEKSPSRKSASASLSRKLQSVF